MFSGFYLTIGIKNISPGSPSTRYHSAGFSDHLLDAQPPSINNLLGKITPAKGLYGFYFLRRFNNITLL